MSSSDRRTTDETSSSNNQSAVDEVLSEFSTITGCDTERARFYLDSANWDLVLALSSFFDDPPASDREEQEIAPGPVQSPNAPEKLICISGSSQRRSQPTAPNSTAEMSRMFTFKDLAKKNQDNAGSDSEEEGQRFFAGGSEHSGQEVVGPPSSRKGRDAHDLVRSVFEQAKAHGATVADPDAEAGSSRRTQRGAFGGTGFRLGAEETPATSAAAASASGQSQRVSPPRSVSVNMYRDGFTIDDDGPFRAYDTPEGREFINSIKSGVIPPELTNRMQGGSSGGEVTVDLKDRHHEDYVPPKKTVKAFKGEGHRLGNIDPPIVAPTAEGSSASGSDSKECEKQASKEIGFDGEKPTTNIQIRLADGSRLIAKMNHSNTVSDIRRFIVTARPQFATSTFSLMTTFPNKELCEESQTLAEANLLGAVVVQKLTA